MSTRNEVYLIYGIKLDYNKVSDDDNYENLDKEHLFFPWCGRGAKGTFGILMDGTNGKYCVAGKCLAIKDDEGDQDFGFMEIPEISAGLGIEVSDWMYANKLLPLIANDALEHNLYLIRHYH
jgi:hypothetical protein